MKRRVLLGFGIVICLFLSDAADAAGFNFPRGELCLVEVPYQDDYHANPHVAFDVFGNAHAVWEDDRYSSVIHMVGCSALVSGGQTDSYFCYGGLETETHLLPFVFKRALSANHMYGFTINSSITPHSLETVVYDLSYLPGSPDMTDLPSNPGFDATSIEDFDMIGGGGYIVYAYKMASVDHLFLGLFDESSKTWVVNHLQVTAPANYRFRHVRLGMDAAGYIYLVYDKEMYGGTPSYSLIARRSSNPFDVTSPLLNERYINGSPSDMLFPDIAVSGAYPSDLKVSIAYIVHQVGTSKEIFCTTENNMDWTMSTWGGNSIPALNSNTSESLTFERPAVAIDAADSVYVVWTDNQLGYQEFFGNISSNGGTTFGSSDQQIAAGISEIVGAFDLTMGPNPGDIALAYIRTNGTNSVPCLLYSSASFFDFCDGSPSMYWTSAANVSVYSSLFYSAPACYRLGGAKGTLLKDYGSVEYQGRISMQFYDSGSILPEDDFYAGVSSSNEKGVIRMLGVRNETTPTSYSYSMDGGVTWQSLGGIRSVGWHEIVFTIDDFGLLMTIEVSPGSVVGTADSLTKFTTLEIAGGTDTSPYFIDDVRIEAFQSDIGPVTTPAVSGLGILATLAGIGGLIHRRRRR
ncbi:hypothetical protein JXA80_08030 [bacterium]|nr:hypothetical protein [candidate division CSSED10-310 bacterium]